MDIQFYWIRGRRPPKVLWCEVNHKMYWFKNNKWNRSLFDMDYYLSSKQIEKLPFFKNLWYTLLHDVPMDKS